MRSMHWINACVLAVASLPSAAAAAELQEIRLWASPDSTRVVFDLSAPVSHAMFSLSGPERIVIDLEQTGADLARLRVPAGGGGGGARRPPPASRTHQFGARNARRADSHR